MIIKLFVMSLFVCSFLSCFSQEKADRVRIGTQVWMSRNLNVDHYRNGDSIPEIRDPAVWSNLTTGAWCYYNNDPENGKKYGKLYNWYAVNDSRGLAPEGWHIPSDAEWTVLENYLGGTHEACAKLKSTGTTGKGDGLWNMPSPDANNESGFSGIPGGYRDLNGDYTDLGDDVCWWSSTQRDSTDAWSRNLYYDFTNFIRYSNYMINGFSVRCLRN